MRTHGRPRALVVDDQEMIRLLAARVLCDGGWSVETAGGVAEALALRPLGFDALVIDTRLGAERGTELLAALRLDDPLVPRRCLILSGASTDPAPDDVAVLLKPFRADDLLDAVNRLSGRPTVDDDPPGGGRQRRTG
ncbi:MULTISPECIES: response regulator [Parafrankia]|uniref:Response regulator receiver protein n=1 Tax=Parafrankia soli TaxID=2599596 RepID=A0A1S1PZ64_9ACTN|nr:MULTISPECIES: response regulator [Parafrankia]OHV27963.1 response regulator receiver protein [Parafrankia soli]TCJ38592.1 response regulator [Parafrankia sp. BMG5.11]CAI7981192.1 Response regulator receiver protein [Frankia sp. Hr75.2]SQD95918.1 Response regulator receiver protein [Parafrankia sp. Ea1.12]